MSKLLAWVVALAACKGSTPARDWSTVALEDTVEGRVGNALFALRLPKDWKRDVDQPLIKGWRPDDVDDYTVEPSVTVGWVQQPPESVDDYIKSLSYAGTPIIDRKLEKASYFEVVSHTEDNGVVRVDYIGHKGDRYVGCSAFQMASGGVPSPQATAEWLARLCESLRIE